MWEMVQKNYGTSLLLFKSERSCHLFAVHMPPIYSYVIPNLLVKSVNSARKISQEVTEQVYGANDEINPI